MPKVSAAYLRAIVEEIVGPYIELHRGSRHDGGWLVPAGRMSGDEITDFVLSNPLLDSDTAWHLADPGLLGFGAQLADVTQAWLRRFRAAVEDWASTNEWAAGDLVYYHVDAWQNDLEHETDIWRSERGDLPPAIFLASAPAHLLLVERLLAEGRPLSDLSWRAFEKLIGEMLEFEGWQVEVMKGTKDGGIDVIAVKSFDLLGRVKSIWQAKKYGKEKKVGVSSIRELSGVLERARATKGVVVTTSTFTGGALEWIRKDHYRLDSLDGEQIELWLKSHVLRSIGSLNGEH